MPDDVKTVEDVQRKLRERHDCLVKRFADGCADPALISSANELQDFAGSCGWLELKQDLQAHARDILAVPDYRKRN